MNLIMFAQSLYGAAAADDVDAAVAAVSLEAHGTDSSALTAVRAVAAAVAWGFQLRGFSLPDPVEFMHLVAPSLPNDCALQRALFAYRTAGMRAIAARGRRSGRRGRYRCRRGALDRTEAALRTAAAQCDPSYREHACCVAVPSCAASVAAVRFRRSGCGAVRACRLRLHCLTRRTGLAH